VLQKYFVPFTLGLVQTAAKSNTVMCQLISNFIFSLQVPYPTD